MRAVPDQKNFNYSGAVMPFDKAIVCALIFVHIISEHSFQ